MQSMIVAGYDKDMRGQDNWRIYFTKEAFEYADALIKEIEK